MTAIEKITIQPLTQLINNDKISTTAEELHGLISGMLSGANNDEKWLRLLIDIVNNGENFTPGLMDKIITLYQQTQKQLQEGQFAFEILIPQDISLAIRVDKLVEWVNAFLLGISLVKPNIASAQGEVREVMADLRQITQLGYTKDENQDELERSFEEILEYVKIAVILCYEDVTRLKTVEYTNSVKR